MKVRPKLPKGWSWPVKPSDVDEQFPGVGHVNWVTGALNKKRTPTLYLTWQPRTAMPEAGLTISAVPSTDRAAIRLWIMDVVAPEARSWLTALETRSPTWLDQWHMESWCWQASEELASGRN